MVYWRVRKVSKRLRVGESDLSAYQNCHSKWSWKQTLQKSITLMPSVTCPYCNEKQYQTRKSKVTNSLLVGGIILFTSAIRVFTTMPIVMWIIIAYFLLHPFLMKLKSGDEVD